MTFDYDYDIFLKITDHFYAKANRDVMIGYHFRVIKDFEEHIPKIASFWQLQLTQKISHPEHLPFNLFAAHRPLGIRKGEVGRWVTLFHATLEHFLREKLIDQKLVDLWHMKIDFFRQRIESFAVNNES